MFKRFAFTPAVVAGSLLFGALAAPAFAADTVELGSGGFSSDVIVAGQREGGGQYRLQESGVSVDELKKAIEDVRKMKESLRDMKDPRDTERASGDLKRTVEDQKDELKELKRTVDDQKREISDLKRTVEDLKRR